MLAARFAAWFEQRGWRPHEHRLAMLQAAEAGQSVLLIAPTGGGKTLAGFLPSLVELERSGGKGLHTLYVSPLKALTTDIARNLQAPIAGWGLRCAARRAPATRRRTDASASASTRRTSC
jgi:ATP-dependent Lhr-like helicase